MLGGLILFGHSSMDRILGYGLKYPDSFEHTHLGMIGKSSWCKNNIPPPSECLLEEGIF